MRRINAVNVTPSSINVSIGTNIKAASYWLPYFTIRAPSPVMAPHDVAPICRAMPDRAIASSWRHLGSAEPFGERQRHVGHGDAVRERFVETHTDELRLREDI
jgi:hypothetical protein